MSEVVNEHDTLELRLAALEIACGNQPDQTLMLLNSAGSCELAVFVEEENSAAYRFGVRFQGNGDGGQLVSDLLLWGAVGHVPSEQGLLVLMNRKAGVSIGDLPLDKAVKIIDLLTQAFTHPDINDNAVQALQSDVNKILYGTNGQVSTDES